MSVVALLVLCFEPASHAHEDDYGIGMVIPPGGDDMSAIIYAKPDVTSDTLATLFRWELTFHGSNEKVRAFLVGFHKYDSWGLPIVSFTLDSTWAQVLVGPSHTYERTRGWVNLKIPGTAFHIWADFLPKQSMVLRRDKALRFYSKPDTNAVWNIKVARYPDRDDYSYVLRPIRRQGRWLLVELTTPDNPCLDTIEEIRKRFGALQRTVKVWIQYIDKRGRPLVQAAMMC
jgi:hypothetical protein